LLHQRLELVELSITGCKVQEKGGLALKAGLDQRAALGPYRRWSPAAVALVFPFQLGYTNLLGDLLQLALGRLQFRLEAESVEFPVGHGGVAVRLRGVVWKRLTGRRGRWIPLNQLEKG
jgi:hypothetical protein